MTSHRRTRLKLLINDYFVAVALILAVIAAGGAWATYTTAIDPGSHVEQRTISTWGVSGDFEYSATIVNATPLSDRGDVRAGRKFYFTNAMPVLDGRFDFGFEGAPGSTTVTTRTTLVNYAVYTQSRIGGPSGFGSQSATRNRSERRIWEIATPLGVERKRIEGGETMTTTFAIDISDIRERIRAIGRALGPISRITDARTAVNVSVQVNGTIGGERVQRSFNYILPVNTSAGYYVVYPPQKPDTQEFTVTRAVRVQNEYGILTILASVVGLVVPLAALVGLFYGRENDWFEVSRTMRADAQRAKLRAEFEEWVTLGTVSEDDRTTVTVDSLEGLVDVAIDSDRRVVEDDETGVYVVLDGDVRYQFTPEWEILTEDESVSEDHDEFEPEGRDGDGGKPDVDPSAGAGGDATSTPARSDDGGDGQPTAVIELPGSTVVHERENEHETDDRSTDSSGVMDRLHSAVESAVGRPSSGRTGSKANGDTDDEPTLTDLRHVGEARAATLREAGFRTVADVRGATLDELQVGDIGATRAEQIRDSAAQIAETTDE